MGLNLAGATIERPKNPELRRRNHLRALVIGGSSGIGLEVARHLAQRGETVCIGGRDLGRAEAAAFALGPAHRGVELDLTRPESVAEALKDVGNIDHLVLTAYERDQNDLSAYDVGGAIRAVTLKVVGYSAVVGALLPNLGRNGSIVLLGGVSRDWRYPGSTTTAAVNGAITAMVRNMAAEIAPLRVNALHPGAVGDSLAVASLPSKLVEKVRRHTATGRLTTLEDAATAVLFLLDNPGVNGVSLALDGGFPVL